MLSRSAERLPANPPARPVLIAALAAVSATGAGLLSAISTWIALTLVAGAAVLPWLVFAPSALAIGSVLVVRGVSDAFADQPLIAGLNSGALIGLILIASAAVQMGVRLYRRTAHTTTVLIVLCLALAITYWFGIGVLRNGAQPSLVRELVRAGSVLAVGLMAASADRTLTASRLATAVVITALVPAAFIVGEAALHWPAMVAGELRPRGTMSHPNAAAILLGVALPLAAWRLLFDHGGWRYLGAVALFAAGILLTRSIGGFAQLVVTLMAFGLLQRGRAAYRLPVLAAAAGLVAFFLFDPLGISRVSELEATSLQVQSLAADDNSFEWRILNWTMLLREWREAPLLGHGLGATYAIVAPLGHLPHSDPVRFLVETGLVGATFALLAYLAVMTKLLVLARHAPGASFPAAVLAVMVGVSTHGLVTHVTFNTAPAYVLAALVGWTLTLPAGSERWAGPAPQPYNRGGATSSYRAATRRA